MMTFEEYKTKISIIQILEDLGYKQDITKGRRQPVFKLEDRNGQKIDEIIIKEPGTSSEHYYDRNNQGGDLICFIKNHINDFPQFHHSNTFVRINMILGHYANIPYIPNIERYNSSPAHGIDKDRYKTVETTVGDLRYLTQERKLNPDTVKTFLPFITRTRDLQSKGTFYNVSFPYTNPIDPQKNITNYELRNYGFKGMAAGGDKSNSLWIADFSSVPLTAKNIYFAESALDALSFYELNKNKINLNESVFCSVGGYISPNQIKNALTCYPNAKVHTCFDNDLNGNLYDIKVHNIIGKMNVDIKVEKDSVLFKTQTREFRLSKEDVSLSRFREEAHATAPMIVHKAEKGYKDFNEVVMNQPKNQISMKL